MSDDEDDCVMFGRPLRPLEQGDTVRKKPIAVEEQIVRDVNGIRRFHGAFTGGFSAGHFNSVDTPQGWYPKQFKSSKAAKAERGTVQKPEDFMDDEDRGEFGFAAQNLRTKSNFQRGGAEGGGNVAGLAGLGGALESLVRPADSTVGEALLMGQGWRPGQGIGPRLTRASRQHTRASHARTYGCSLPAEAGQEAVQQPELDPELERYKDFLFAPDDLPTNIARPKDDFFGIGYSGLDRAGLAGLTNKAGAGAAISGFRVGAALGGSRKKFSISGEAFGVAADEEDDDLEVYNRYFAVLFEKSLVLNNFRINMRRFLTGHSCSLKMFT